MSFLFDAYYISELHNGVYLRQLKLLFDFVKDYLIIFFSGVTSILFATYFMYMWKIRKKYYPLEATLLTLGYFLLLIALKNDNEIIVIFFTLAISMIITLLISAYFFQGQKFKLNKKAKILFHYTLFILFYFILSNITFFKTTYIYTSSYYKIQAVNFTKNGLLNYLDEFNRQNKHMQLQVIDNSNTQTTEIIIRGEKIK
jgi:hypothetical protein